MRDEQTPKDVCGEANKGAVPDSNTLGKNGQLKTETFACNWQ